MPQSSQHEREVVMRTIVVCSAVMGGLDNVSSTCYCDRLLIMVMVSILKGVLTILPSLGYQAYEGDVGIPIV